MRKSLFGALLTIISLLFGGNSFGENTTVKILSDIEEYIRAGESASTELAQSIIDQIEKEPAGVAGAIIQKLKIPDVNEQALCTYIWAIGFTKDANAVDELIKVSNTSKSAPVKANVFQSLARIGGEKAGVYLLAQAKTAPDTDNSEAKLKEIGKFETLNCLAEMQYVPALPEMETLLKKDYEKYYWQQIFCFGKMGDKAIPFLLERINSSDRNVRLASIGLLGQILAAPEAVKPLTVRFWKEKDPFVRNVILSSLEKSFLDFKETEKFFKKVTTKEKDKDVKKFADETLANLDQFRKKVGETKAKKKDDRTLFETTYNNLYKSYGHNGNFETLAVLSCRDDEPKLKKLRERILCRNSDECFYDYEKVNIIIVFNRLIASEQADKSRSKK